MEIQWIRGTTILWNKRSSRSELAYVPNSTRVRARTPSRACNAISRAFSSANAQCKLQCDPYKCTSTIVTSNVVARFPFAPLPRLTVNFTTFDFDSRSQTLRLSPDFSPLLPGLAPAAVPLFLPFFFNFLSNSRAARRNFFTAEIFPTFVGFISREILEFSNPKLSPSLQFSKMNLLVGKVNKSLRAILLSLSSLSLIKIIFFVVINPWKLRKPDRIQIFTLFAIILIKSNRSISFSFLNQESSKWRRNTKCKR